MSYDASDAARDEMYDEIARELYPDHKRQAIREFTADRLRSYYLANPLVMQPAAQALQEGQALQAKEHHSAALVFYVTAIELFLKASLLRPVVHGLVHSDGLAEVIVQQALGQTGFDRYTKLLTKLFLELVGVDIATVQRNLAAKPLLEECTEQQALRNRVIHQGVTVTREQAQNGLHVTEGTYEGIVYPTLRKLGLNVVTHGVIVRSEESAANNS